MGGMGISHWTSWLACSALAVMAAASNADDPTVHYTRAVKPLLSSRCYACHGALKQESELRLDTAAAMLAGGSNGPAVVARGPDASTIMARVTSADPATRMPPEGAPLTADQIEHLRQWIQQGAAAPADEQPEIDPRQHWAFQKLVRPKVPTWDGESEHNAIDAFIVESLKTQRLQPQPPAAKQILLRRVYLDLIGLPPTQDELLAFVADEAPDAYEQVVDRLLLDERYGERWGRHWMDIWRYSDWYGRRDAQDVRNSASQIFRWRDWIVRSLNEGKGYDRMIHEMLAADEIRPEDYDAGVATGYLIRNYYSLNPNDWMRNAVEHTGKAFLGLTFNCAHCHDHKYDPISQEDYFRLRAFFEPVYIRQDRVPGEADPGPFQDYSYAATRSVQRLGAARVYDRQLDAPTWFYTGGDERNRVKERGSIPPGIPAFLQSETLRIEPVALPPQAWYPGLRPEIQEAMLADARRAVRDAGADRDTGHETDTAVAFGSAVNEDAVNEQEVSKRAAAAQVAAARAELASLEARIAAERAKYIQPTGSDAAEQARTASRAEREAIALRADSNRWLQELALLKAAAIPAGDAHRAEKIEAATQGLANAKAAVDQAKAALADEKLAESYAPLSPQFPPQSTGRRRALAQWITHRDNPLTARVAVNHIWTRHFHAPLVASMYDFGRKGVRPTHPELLDWLAVEFMEAGWDMKHLHRLIVTSAAYRRGSQHSYEASNQDPENRFLWRMNSNRMEAEVLRDSLLYVAGQLDLAIGGVELENTDALTTNRRTLYYSSFPEAGGKSALGELFDAPDPLDCYRRVSSIVPQQALALTNSDLVHRSSVAMVRAWQESLGRATGEDGEVAPLGFVQDMFARILCRAPTVEEQRVSREILQTQQQLAAQPESDTAITEARQSFVRVLLNHNDFVTVR